MGGEVTPGPKQERVPWHLLQLFDPFSRTARANARKSAADIAASVEARRVLGAELQRRPGTTMGPSDAPTSSAQTSPSRRLVSLSKQECLALLEHGTLGRLAFMARAGIPLIVPVNYVFDGKAILIRSGPGPKLQAAERGDSVSFEVDDINEDLRVGWSVVVTGTAQRLRRAPAGHRTSEGGRVAVPFAWADGPRDHLMRISISRITGRWLTVGS